MFWFNYKETEIKAMLSIASGVNTSSELREANRGVYNGALSLVKKGDVVKDGDSFILNENLLEKLNFGRKEVITVEDKEDCIAWLKKIDKKIDSLSGTEVTGTPVVSGTPIKATNKSNFSDSIKEETPVLSEKQQLAANIALRDIFKDIAYNGFHGGDISSFNDLPEVSWMTGYLKEYVREETRKRLSEYDIDITLFKI